ncbi:MAG: GTP-binding protein [Candidatus Dojkabacteria bacterium]
MKIPITTITGTLGAGKTTIIRNIIKKLPESYKVVWVKNEYGDLNVDTILAKSKNIQTKEVINGCLCCVLIGKLKDAILEILKDYTPDRIIIETAGTAYPYPIIHEINEISGTKNDGVVKVVDALNFERLEDTSEFAKQQANYIDLIIINKINLAGEQKIEKVNDSIFEIYPDNPKIYTADGNVEPDLIFGLDLKIGSNHIGILNENSNYRSISPVPETTFSLTNEKEGQVTTKKQGSDITKQSFDTSKHYGENVTHNHYQENHEHIETFTIKLDSKDKALVKNKIQKILNKLAPSDFIRIKGIVQEKGKYFILNYVLGRVEWEEIETYSGQSQLIFMGKKILGLKNKLEREFKVII